MNREEIPQTMFFYKHPYFLALAYFLQFYPTVFKLFLFDPLHRTISDTKFHDLNIEKCHNSENLNNYLWYFIDTSLTDASLRTKILNWK